MKLHLLTLCPLLSCVLLPSAGQSALRVPVTGFVLDSQIHAIRPIQGFPGSAVFGEPLEMPAPISAVTVSMSGDFALAATSADSGTLLMVRGLREGSPQSAPIEGAIAGIELMAISADGSTAVLLSRLSRCLQFLTGLPDRPTPLTPISLEEVQGRVNSLSITSQGSQAALTSSLEQSGAVFLVDQLPGAVPRSIAAAQLPIAALYVNEDHDLIYLDAAAPQLVLLRDADGARQQQVLLSSEQGLQAPSAFSVSGATVWLADIRSRDSGSTGHLIVFDLERTQVISEKDITALPDRFQALGPSGVFALNALESGPVYLLSSSDSSVVFVPSILR